MNPRFLISLHIACFIALVSSASIPARGQTPAVSRTASTYTVPRTPDGQPDLQGYWTNATYTPLERPNNVTKEFYTPEEAAQIEKQSAANESAQTVPGTTADVHYDFTQFQLDRSQSTV